MGSIDDGSWKRKNQLWTLASGAFDIGHLIARTLPIDSLPVSSMTKRWHACCFLWRNRAVAGFLLDQVEPEKPFC